MTLCYERLESEPEPVVVEIPIREYGIRKFVYVRRENVQKKI